MALSQVSESDIERLTSQLETEFQILWEAGTAIGGEPARAPAASSRPAAAQKGLPAPQGLAAERPNLPRDGAPPPPARVAVNRATAKIMIVDDEPINIKVVRKFLQEAGYANFVAENEATRAFARLREELPDVVLLDVMMPEVSGVDILKQIRADAALAHVPVLILTASCDRETKLEVLRHGATDFLSKPVDPAELAPRVGNALLMKAHHDHLQTQAVALEEAVRQRTAELAVSRLEVVHCLARAAEFRDDCTGRHVVRVGLYAGIIGRELGLSEAQAHLLELAAQLHDVGKIGIPDQILLKAGPLTSEEYELMQRHCSFGKRVFDRINESEMKYLRMHSELGARMLETSRSPLVQLAARVALTHHERWDGSGYPLGLAGHDIPLEGRVTAVADVFDALSTKRPYKAAFPVEKCFKILEEGRGAQFDPAILDAFFRRRDEIVAVQIEYADVD